MAYTNKITCDQTLTAEDILRLVLLSNGNDHALRVVNVGEPLADVVLYSTDFNNGGALPGGITVSDNVDVIIDNNADYVPNGSGYTGASGGYKIVFTDILNGDAYASFTISGIVTTGKENLRLSFGCVDIVSSEAGAVEYSLNGVDWVAVGGVAFGGDPWSLRTVTLPEACENVANLRLRWIWQQGGFGDYKGFDDVKLIGDEI